MYNVKTKVTGTTGTVSKSFRKYLSNISEKYKIKELQKTAILGTVHILQEVLMLKYKTYSTCKITLYVAQIVTTEWLE
jgi:hypothetical protein